MVPRLHLHTKAIVHICHSLVGWDLKTIVLVVFGLWALRYRHTNCHHSNRLLHSKSIPTTEIDHMKTCVCFRRRCSLPAVVIPHYNSTIHINCPQPCSQYSFIQRVLHSNTAFHSNNKNSHYCFNNRIMDSHHYGVVHYYNYSSHIGWEYAMANAFEFGCTK